MKEWKAHTFKNDEEFFAFLDMQLGVVNTSATLKRASATFPGGGTQVPRPSSPYIWTSPDHWTCQDTNGDMQTYQIVDMADEHLWNTVNWLLDNKAELFELCSDSPVRPGTDIALASIHWLKVQPAFIGLVYEAVARGLTFSDTTAAFLRKYLMPDASADLAAKPWRQPFSQNTLPELKETLGNKISATKTKNSFGKAPRVFRYDSKNSQG